MSLPYAVEPMRIVDLDEVLRIEHASFPRPWSVQTFLMELALPYTCYLVARLEKHSAQEAAEANRLRRRRGLRGADRDKRPRIRGAVVGYSGLRVVMGEGHIMNLAVHPSYRQRGIGQLLLLHQFDQARKRGALRLTLEVRVSNIAAHNLYRKYGFQVEGRRRRYYSDGEDALVMRTDPLDAAETQARFSELRDRLMERLTSGVSSGEESSDSDPGSGNIL